MILAALTEKKELIRFTVLVILALIVGGYLLCLERRRTPKKPDTPLPLTPERLAAASDSEAVSLVAADLLSRQDPKNPQPYLTVPPLGEARCTVYCIWLYDHTLREDGAAALLQKPTVLFSELAPDAYRSVGAVACADAIEAVFSAKESAALAEAENAYRNAAESEAPLSACAAYIRSQPSLFCDGEDGGANDS